MQTAPKTAEEAAQQYLDDSSNKGVRKCVKHHGRALTRKLIIALWNRDWGTDRENKTINFFTQYASTLKEHKVKDFIRVLS